MWKDLNKNGLTLLKLCGFSPQCDLLIDLWPIYGLYWNRFRHRPFLSRAICFVIECNSVYLLVYIISPDECEDMYETCPEMKKNFYCTNYTDLMKIQCKKSCGFCGKIDFPCNCFSKGFHYSAKIK